MIELVELGDGWFNVLNDGRVWGLAACSDWLTSESNSEEGAIDDCAICEGGGSGVPARDSGDTDRFDSVPEDGRRWPGGGVPFSERGVWWPVDALLDETNRV